MRSPSVADHVAFSSWPVEEQELARLVVGEEAAAAVSEKMWQLEDEIAAAEGMYEGLVHRIDGLIKEIEAGKLDVPGIVRWLKTL